VNNQARHLKLRDIVLKAYGNKCSCCGEKERKFLTLDHITQEVSYGKGGMSFYTRVKNLGFPSSIRVLCFNCNCGRSCNGGICPHESIKKIGNSGA
jgi:hypothetical protein